MHQLPVHERRGGEQRDHPLLCSGALASAVPPAEDGCVSLRSSHHDERVYLLIQSQSNANAGLPAQNARLMVPRALYRTLAASESRLRCPQSTQTTKWRHCTRDFRFAGPRWHLYTPESRRAHEILFGAQSCSSRGRHLSPRRRSTDWRPCFQGISQTPLHTCALSSPRGLRCTRPRVSLPALAAPRSSSACRRRAAGSDALLPAAASSTGHASRAGPRSSPAAAGDS